MSIQMPKRAIHLFLLMAILVLPAASCTEYQAPSILLITIDTLRADHLGAYETELSRTPYIDRLASEATIFESAAAPMPLTRPSHFSLLSSLYPREHGVLNNRMSLPADVPTVTEIFRKSGYRTGAFVAVSLLGRRSGAGRGFEVHDVPSERQRSAEEVIPQALHWISGLGADEKFFAWVHLFDPHQPYAPPDAYREANGSDMDQSMPSVSWPELLEVSERNDGHIPSSVLEHAKRLYRGEVAWTDQWIGTLIEGLSASRELDDVLVVLTADHGECFENGTYFDHSDCLFEGAIRIPLIIRHPRSFSPGARVSSQVSIIDVAPTLLRSGGIDIPEAFSGRALQDVDGAGDRYVLIQPPFYQPEATKGWLKNRRSLRSVAGVPTQQHKVGVVRMGMVGSSWKYIRTGDKEELYRLSPGASNREELAEADEGVLEELRQMLDELLTEHPLNVVEPEKINDELRATLQALGYLEPS